jgi:hypothetical protein
METLYPLRGERATNLPPSYGRHSAGDLLDQVFSLYRRGFPIFVAVAALMLVPLAIIWLIQRQSDDDAIRTTLTMVNDAVSVAYYALVPAATCLVAAALRRGQRLGPQAAYDTARGRFWPLIRLAILKFLVFMVYLLVASIGVGLSLLGGPWLMIPVLAGTLAVGIYLFVKWSLAEPALLFETNLKARQSFGRSADLVRGSLRRVGLVVGAIWLIMVVLHIVIYVTGLAVAGELRALLDAAGSGELPTALAGLARSQGLRADVVLSLFTTTGSVLLAPFTGIVQAVLYFTQRSDLEGADLLAEADAVSEAS